MYNEKFVDELAQIIWDYHLLGHELEKADCIFVLGNHDIQVADYGIGLWHKDLAPVIAFSGGVTQDDARMNVHWGDTEANLFAQKARASGIPESAIVIENNAANTGENSDID